MGPDQATMNDAICMVYYEFFYVLISHVSVTLDKQSHAQLPIHTTLILADHSGDLHVYLCLVSLKILQGLLDNGS